MSLAIAQLTVTVVLVVLAALALTALGIGRLESPSGILRDGLPHGAPAPTWSLVDSQGRLHCCPRKSGWQVVLFAEHSLASFPSSVRAFVRLDEETRLDCLVATRGDPHLVTAVFKALTKHQVAVMKVSEDFYTEHRVRVMLFMYVTDESGSVRAMGLANSDDQIFRIWRHATLVGVPSRGIAKVLV
jgi:hypothetical protein